MTKEKISQTELKKSLEEVSKLLISHCSGRPYHEEDKREHSLKAIEALAQCGIDGNCRRWWKEDENGNMLPEEG